MTIHRMQRVYVDASAIGGAFNQKFAEQTQPFWRAVHRGEVAMVISDVLEGEVAKAPKIVRDFYNALPESQIEKVVSTDESNHLAAQYIAENVVGPTNLDDCKHIALATLAHADVLVSWNFKHIVNVTRILGHNGVNMKLGYAQINIRTPYEVIHDET
ncbi:MAG: hypothetical protein ACRC46_14855 [Thermoguttaceae bacterium]